MNLSSEPANLGEQVKPIHEPTLANEITPKKAL